MSLLEQASLVVTPNAYKESKLYSVIPNTTLGDMDVVRATTATRVNEQGLIEVVPRNLLTYSNDFSNASWDKQEMNITINSAIAPDGTMTANFVIPTAVTSTHQISKNVSASGVNTMSVFAKANGYNTIHILDFANGFHGASFNLSTGVVTNSGSGVGSIQNVGNGWYRCIATATTTGIRFYIPSPAGDFTGNGTSGIYIWGAQLEQGSYATSYIPTVATAVTRNADVISKTGISSLIGQTEGTAFIECTADNSNPNGAMLIYLGSSDGSGAFNYSTYLKFDGDSLNFTVYSGGNNYVNSTSTQTYTNKQNIKVAIAYKNNDFICYANGVQLFTDITGIVSTNLSSLSLSHYPPNIPYNQYNGNIKSTQLYKTRLTNTELASLTTI